MASLPSDGFDDLLFEMYKKQDGGPGTSDLGDCKSRLGSFLASFVAREGVHTSADSELSLGGVNSRLESMFGSVLSKEFDSCPWSSNGGRTTKKQKDHHGMLGETTTITQQVAHDKDTCHKSPNISNLLQ